VPLAAGSSALSSAPCVAGADVDGVGVPAFGVAVAGGDVGETVIVGAKAGTGVDVEETGVTTSGRGRSSSARPILAVVGRTATSTSTRDTSR
jgi:hypothetical protein